jgi:hypothetical protein
MSDEKIGKFLDLEPIEDAVFEDDEIEEDAEITSLDVYRDMSPDEPTGNDFDDQHIADIDLARDNIEKLVKTGTKSLEQLAELARQSDSPTAYDVIGKLMKTLLDANKDFVDISEKRKYAKEEKTTKRGDENGGGVTNNNLIVASTNDIDDILEGIRNKKKGNSNG